MTIRMDGMYLPMSSVLCTSEGKLDINVEALGRPKLYTDVEIQAGTPSPLEECGEL